MFTSLSGLWERRLEMRRLCNCLFSSCDLTSWSSSCMRFLLGFFLWWNGASFRASFSIFLKYVSCLKKKSLRSWRSPSPVIHLRPVRVWLTVRLLRPHRTRNWGNSEDPAGERNISLKSCLTCHMIIKDQWKQWQIYENSLCISERMTGLFLIIFMINEKWH